MGGNEVSGKKIVLMLFPRFLDPGSEYPDLPLNLLALGSFVESRSLAEDRGYKVMILDQINWPDNKFYQMIEQFLPNAVCACISAMTAQVPHALRISRFIRDHSPATPIIWGGKHPTIFPEQTAAHELVDVAVVGEGEYVLWELLNSMDDKQKLAGNPELSHIAGVAYRDGARVSINKARAPLHMDDLPPLNYSLADATRLFSYDEIQQRRRYGFPVLTSRGCPFECTFCLNNILRIGVRFRKASLVLDDLEAMAKQGIRNLQVSDECFFINRKRAEDIVYGIIDRKLAITWSATARVNFFNDQFIDRGFLKDIMRAGCTEFLMGAESGSQRILDKIKKGITVDDTLNAARMLDEVGAGGNFSFMIGVPGETKEDIKKTLKLIYQISRINPRSTFNGPMIFRPYPGSELFDEISQHISFPRSLDGWESCQLLFGDRSLVPVHYAWLPVSDSDIMKYRFYGSIANGFTENKQYGKWYFRLGEYFLKKVVRARIKHDFYSLPWDYRLYQAVYNFQRKGETKKLMACQEESPQGHHLKHNVNS